MLKNAPTLASGGVDTEENEHFEVCPLSVYGSPRFDDLVRSTLFLELMNALLEHLQESVINQDEERWNVYHRTGTRRQSVHVNLTQESQTMKTFAEKYALIKE